MQNHYATEKLTQDRIQERLAQADESRLAAVATAPNRPSRFARFTTLLARFVEDEAVDDLGFVPALTDYPAHGAGAAI